MHRHSGSLLLGLAAPWFHPNQPQPFLSVPSIGWAHYFGSSALRQAYQTWSGSAGTALGRVSVALLHHLHGQTIGVSSASCLEKRPPLPALFRLIPFCATMQLAPRRFQLGAQSNDGCLELQFGQLLQTHRMVPECQLHSAAHHHCDDHDDTSSTFVDFRTGI